MIQMDNYNSLTAISPKRHKTGRYKADTAFLR